MKLAISKQLVLVLIILSLGLFFTQKASAATLGSISDTVSTSRPSASAPLNVNQGTSDASVVVVDNGSIYLASDSAIIYKDTGETTSTGINIASMSAQIAGSPNTRNVYLTSTISNTHHKGDALVVNITATHTIRFTTTTGVPGSGHIIITFPGTGSNIASPSASTFAFNNIASGQIAVNNATCSSWSITAPTLDCTLNGSGIAGGVTVTVILGCTTQSSGVCTSFSPRLINPTKSAAAGTADTWKVSVSTTDASSIVLDTSKAVVGTIDAVQVQGTVEPYLTFTIAGVANGASVCSDTTNPGTGLDSTATFVNLGSLSNAINLSAQTLVVSTNGSAGYALTATSSGRFINPASGFWIADANGGNGLTANDATNGTSPVPASIVAGTSAYGIHPCTAGGTSIPTIPAGWGSGGGSGNKFANPWNTGVNGFYAALASYNAPASNSTTTVEYGATAALTTPAGIYSNVFTYVATPIF